MAFTERSSSRKPTADRRCDRDELLLIDDWRLTQEARIDPSFGAMGDRSHGGRLGNWVTINGAGEWRVEVGRHERLRLRLANAANARILVLGLHGLEGWVVALDGQPLAAPEPLERLLLAPAQRADLIVDAIAEEGMDAFLVSLERDGAYRIASFRVDGTIRGPDAHAAHRRHWSPIRSRVAARARRCEAREASDAGRCHGRHAERGPGGTRDGNPRDGGSGTGVGVQRRRGLRRCSPLLELAAGEVARIAIVNQTVWPHAMHLHGHHFRRVGEDGTLGPLRDTLLLDRQEAAEIAFVADNPGDWLLHCHMPEHSAGGMETWIRVG